MSQTRVVVVVVKAVGEQNRANGGKQGRPGERGGCRRQARVTKLAGATATRQGWRPPKEGVFLAGVAARTQVVQCQPTGSMTLQLSNEVTVSSGRAGRQRRRRIQLAKKLGERCVKFHDSGVPARVICSGGGQK